MLHIITLNLPISQYSFSIAQVAIKQFNNWTKQLSVRYLASYHTYEKDKGKVEWMLWLTIWQVTDPLAYLFWQD